MPVSLRKACHACILAKRRCQPQLPKCSRCLKNDKVCTYDLEPLLHVSPITEQPVAGTNPQENQQIPLDSYPQPTYAVFDTVASAHQAAIQSLNLQNQGLNTPELRMVVDQDIFHWIISQLTNVPELILQRQTLPFVHAQLYLEGADSTARIKHILELHMGISGGSLDKVIRPSQNVYLQRLANMNIKGLCLHEVLFSIQELGLYLIIYICNGLPSCYKSEAQQHLDLLMDWVEHLWTATQEKQSKPYTQWRAWLVAESARRSMLACYFIRGAISILSSGYCMYLPFLESLPFDSRTGLWEAMTENDWQAAVTKQGGQPEVLMSFREFIESSEDLSHIKHTGVFQRLLLTAYYGKRALQALNTV